MVSNYKPKFKSLSVQNSMKKIASCLISTRMESPMSS